MRKEYVYYHRKSREIYISEEKIADFAWCTIYDSHRFYSNKLESSTDIWRDIWLSKDTGEDLILLGEL